jgi:hypothetical protein
MARSGHARRMPAGDVHRDIHEKGARIGENQEHAS